MEKLNQVARYGVDGYGRQDIHRDDENGEFVDYEDFKEMQQRAEAAEAESKHQLSVNVLVSEHHQRLVAEHNALQARLAELEQQEPDYVLYDCGCCGHEMLMGASYSGRCMKCNYSTLRHAELFTRPATAVPAGWKLVPVEPTEEMIAAGDQFMDGLSRLGDAYDAMLAAAPEVVSRKR